LFVDSLANLIGPPLLLQTRLAIVASGSRRDCGGKGEEGSGRSGKRGEGRAGPGAAGIGAAGRRRRWTSEVAAAAAARASP
ncbi:unnamed protein product, partial [Colias eurytheme]